MVSIREDGRVEFRFFRPGASRVTIAGDFDRWSGSLEMRNAGRGWWIFDAELPPGEYRFRYRADGAWFTDYAAFGVELGRFGWNSVLIVPEAESVGMESQQEFERARIAA
ncbi:MAG: glycogen-binding domain-containing protein [Phycisphaerae bacterium]|nr:glycogen-binding domain-containing protein [Phycisphaerae bacterium]MDW8261573.1 glycogen-binding domain-containing protein [Phycisphaerales bacterium]